MRGLIHVFSIDGHYVALDVATGSVHFLDELSYRILKSIEENSGCIGCIPADTLQERFGPEAVGDVLKEIRDLERNGLLFSSDPLIELSRGGSSQSATDAALWERMDPVPIVKALCLDVTHACNLRCSYCFASETTSNYSGETMTPEVGCRAVDFLLEASGPRQRCEIDFFGGEPLLAFPTVVRVIEHARKREQDTGKKVRFTLTTNAVGLTPEINDFLNSQDVAMILSLDGRPEVHDTMRKSAGGKGTFDRVIGSIRSFVDSKGSSDYYVRGTYTRNNLDFSNDVQFMLDQGLSRLSLEPVVAEHTQGFAITHQDLHQIRGEYEKLAHLYLKRWRQGKPFVFFHFEVNLDKSPCLAKRIYGCGAGFHYMAVAPDGSLFPCHQFVGKEEFLMGDIWKGVVEPKIRSLFKGANAITKESCKTCWARYFCGGGCHASALLFNGDILKPYDIGCELQKARLEAAIYVKAAQSQREKITDTP